MQRVSRRQFLKDIILGQVEVAEIDGASAFEQLSHMKGGPSIEVLLDLALGQDEAIALEAANGVENAAGVLVRSGHRPFGRCT